MRLGAGSQSVSESTRLYIGVLQERIKALELAAVAPSEPQALRKSPEAALFKAHMLATRYQLLSVLSCIIMRPICIYIYYILYFYYILYIIYRIFFLLVFQSAFLI